ncbi:MAG: hypothetical protein FWF54_02030 [Candidatus Azobacteroides sp.]|nr:hypothetical protein [Candidatus Azobacteroides sp.]
MKTQLRYTKWLTEPIDELWKKVSELIPHHKENNVPSEDIGADEYEYLRDFVSYYKESSPHSHYLAVIDDLNKYGYFGNDKASEKEVLLLKSIIAIAEKKQGRPLWEVLHMIVFNNANYKNFFVMYLPIPNAAKKFLGSIIARLENQQKAIESDKRLNNIWKSPQTILQAG